MNVIGAREHNYLYEHGAELLRSIITGLAFIFTFVKLYIDTKKETNTEKVKNEKTLIMLDLISEKYIGKIEFLENKLIDIKQEFAIKIGLDEEQQTYRINLKDIESSNQMHFKEIFHTNSFDKYFILENFKLIKESYIINHINKFKDELTKILSNKHINLQLNSLEKINNKLNVLSELLDELEEIDKFINIVEISVMREFNHPNFITSKSGKDEDENIQDFENKIISKKVKEIEKITQILSKSKQKLV
ncbi:hypothetical protein ACWESC_10595 [Staphylococcus xylosus]